MAPRKPTPLTLGWREMANLPDMGGVRLRAKMDTGAKSSALHATAIRLVKVEGVASVQFRVPRPGGGGMQTVVCPLVEHRSIRSSNGQEEKRPVIRTRLGLAGRVWIVELTLTNRKDMTFPMLVGRDALRGRALIDSAHSYLHGKPEKRP